MKKLSRIFIISLLIIMTLSTIIVLREKTNNINTYEYKANSNSMISMMLQNEEGNYVESEDLSWPTEDYRFNAKLSKCTNGSKLKYNELENTINVETAKTDKCFAYFDNNSFVEDLSGNGNHGKAVGVASWNGEGVITSDDKKQGYIDCGLYKHDFGNQFSIIIRLNVKTLSDYRAHYFGNWQVAGFGFLSDPGVPRFQLWLQTVNDSSYDIITASEEFKINTWYTLVGTYDNQNLKLYINGVIDTSHNLTGNISIPPAMLAIGVNPDGYGHSGQYGYNITSDALIFERALSAEEIAKDYANEINPTNKDDMLLWYKF